MLRRTLDDERIALEGRLLRVSFASAAPCFACDLTAVGGAMARTVPLLPAGGRYSCLLDLAGLDTGVFAITIRSGTGTLAFGESIAERQAKLARRAAGVQRIAAAPLAGSGAAGFATLYADPATGGLRLRLSASDDTDAFLAGEASAPAVRFSVVSAVYNVERYLDEFLSSLVDQSLDFRSRIEVIVVDDGSTDRSAKILKRWQRKHPDNIHYVGKENGGVSSARNAGLLHATHEWITFIDPDDFVDRDYFTVVADTIRRHGADDLAMIACNHIFFVEAEGKASDTHPLRFRFADGEKVMPLREADRFVQLNCNSAFFRRSAIAAAGLTFDSRVRPSFEDVHFVGRYLLSVPDARIAFQPAARYFYRKRADKSSLVDGLSGHPEWYGDYIRYGTLGLLKAAREHGAISRQVQNTILYSLSWKFRHVVDRPEVLSFLGEQRREQFFALLSEAFSLIDANAIMDYDLTEMPFFYRAGILNLFKDMDPPAQIAEVEGFDAAKSLARVVYWTRSDEPSATFLCDGRTAEPVFRKVRRHDFAGRPFVWEHINWVSLADRERLSVSINDRPATLAVHHRRFADGALCAEIKSALRPQVLPEPAMIEQVRGLRRTARSPKAMQDFRDAWLFMDRDDQADDSAEHLYRHVRKHRPDINAFFILAPDAADWKRLAADGFRLLPFNSPDHLFALTNARLLISSQADHYVTGLFDPRYFSDLQTYRFVFLQHGVIKDDISSWLNRLPIDLMITSTRPEYESIVGDGTAYRLTRKEVALTGLPRHDVLLRGNSAEARYVVVMPTWRSSLTGPAPGPGNARSVDPAFYESIFFRRWKSLLRAPRLAALAARGCEIVFVPHPNMEQYLDRFALPATVRVRRFSEGNPLQEIFQKCAALITDYSSKAFDVAYLGKPVVYYQFEGDAFFTGGHLTRAGYFDYARDGFGPVLHEEDAVLDAVEAILAGTPPDPVFRERAEATFAFRDGKCCERVYDAIVALDGTAGQPHDAAGHERSAVRTAGSPADLAPAGGAP